jgi:hypothetical protein
MSFELNFLHSIVQCLNTIHVDFYVILHRITFSVHLPVQIWLIFRLIGDVFAPKMILYVAKNR